MLARCYGLATLKVLADMDAGMAHLRYAYTDYIARQSTPFTSTDGVKTCRMDGAKADLPKSRNGSTLSGGDRYWNTGKTLSKGRC